MSTQGQSNDWSDRILALCICLGRFSAHFDDVINDLKSLEQSPWPEKTEDDPKGNPRFPFLDIVFKSLNFLEELSDTRNIDRQFGIDLKEDLITLSNDSKEAKTKYSSLIMYLKHPTRYDYVPKGLKDLYATLNQVRSDLSKVKVKVQDDPKISKIFETSKIKEILEEEKKLDHDENKKRIKEMLKLGTKSFLELPNDTFPERATGA